MVVFYLKECVMNLFQPLNPGYTELTHSPYIPLLPNLCYLQHVGGQRDVCRRWGPFQPDVRAVDDAGRLWPRQRATAVDGTGAAAPAAVPLRPGAPCLQAAERHKHTGKEAKPRDADAMFSLG